MANDPTRAEALPPDLLADITVVLETEGFSDLADALARAVRAAEERLALADRLAEAVKAFLVAEGEWDDMDPERLSGHMIAAIVEGKAEARGVLATALAAFLAAQRAAGEEGSRG